MLTGKTKHGFAYAIPRARLSNMRLVDALANVRKANEEDTLLEYTQVIDLVMRKDKEKLYTFFEDEDGNVDSVKVIETVNEILENSSESNEEIKNS